MTSATTLRQRLKINLFFSLIAEAVNKLVPLLTLTIAKQRLGTNAFGSAQYALNFVELLVPLQMFGYYQLAPVLLGPVQKDQEKMATILGNLLSLKFLQGLFTGVIGSVLIWQVAQFRAYQSLLWPLMGMLLFCSLDCTFLFIAVQRVATYSKCMMIAKLMSLVLIFLAVHAPTDTLLYVAITFGANALVSLYSLLWTLRHYRFHFPTRAMLRKIFWQALPVGLFVTLCLSLDRLDLFFVEHWYGEDGAGIYAGPFKMVKSLQYVAITVGTVFFSEMVAGPTPSTMRRLVFASLGSAAAIGILSLAGSHLLGEWFLGWMFGADVAGHARILTVLCLSLIPSAWLQILCSQALLAQRQMKAAALSAGAAVMLTGPCVYGAHLLWGMPGIALGMGAAAAFGALLALWFFSRQVSLSKNLTPQ